MRLSHVLQTGVWCRLPTVRARAVAAAWLLFSAVSGAQDANHGKQLYNTSLAPGELSCSAGACHGPNPLARQNKIQNGDTPDGIAFALNTVVQMAGLRGHINGAQILDLAAYIADPASATGAPTLQLSPSALNFSATAPGNTAPAQTLSISNTGTAALSIGTVSSSSSEFPVTTNCATVAVGSSCTVTAGFAPGTLGARSATLSIAHNDVSLANPLLVALTGDSAAAFVSFSPSDGLTFPPTTVGRNAMMQTVEVSNTGNLPLTLASVALNPSASSFVISVAGTTCVSGFVLAAASTCLLGIVYTPAAPGGEQVQLVIQHTGIGGSTSLPVSGTGVAVGAGNATMTEFRYAPLDYYFMTSREGEKALLDSLNGWSRTGESFPVLPDSGDAGSGRKGISRYYFDQVARNNSRGSHFYTLVESEKLALTTLNPGNAQQPRLPFNEGSDAWAYAPVIEGVGGSCASGQLPVYRLFRAAAKFPDDPNHRFTTSRVLYDQFVALGWDGEGVKFCVAAQ
ncbi:MAG: choice-of-anchor D domain-containing protein [Burkholderiales bacterium]|nr:choice-of-anchor D domain-containing protein [Burkholderiales bacterium]